MLKIQWKFNVENTECMLGKPSKFLSENFYIFSTFTLALNSTINVGKGNKNKSTYVKKRNRQKPAYFLPRIVCDVSRLGFLSRELIPARKPNLTTWNDLILDYKRLFKISLTILNFSMVPWIQKPVFLMIRDAFSI